MVEKVTLQMEDQTAAALQSYTQNVKGAGQASDNFNTEANGVVDALKLQQKELDDSILKLKQLGDAAKKSANESKNAKVQLGGWQSAALGIAAVGSSVTGVISLLKQSAEMGRKAYQGISMLSEQGSPSFRKLKEAIDGVGAAFGRMFEDPRVAGLADKMADGLTEKVIPTIERLPDYWQNAQRGAASYFTAVYGYFAGYDDIQASLDDEYKARDELLGKEREEADAKKKLLLIGDEQKELTKFLTQLDNQRSNNALELSLKEVETYEEVNALMQERLALLQQQIESGSLDKEGLKAAEAELLVYEKRKQEIQAKALADEQEAAKKAAEDQKKLDADIAKSKMDLYESEVKAFNDKEQQEVEQLKKKRDLYEDNKSAAEKLTKELEDAENDRVKKAKQIEDDRRKAFDSQTHTQDDMLKEQKRRLEQEAELEKTHSAFLSDEDARRTKQSVDEWKKKQEALKQAMQGGNGQQGLMDQMGGSGADVTNRLIKQRQQEALANGNFKNDKAKQRAMQQIKRQTISQATDQGLISGAGDLARADGARKKQQKAAAAAQKRQQRRLKSSMGAGLDEDQSQGISGAEITKAQGDNVAAFLQKQQAEGKLSEETVQTLADLTKEVVDDAKKADKLSQQVADIRKQLGITATDTNPADAATRENNQRMGYGGY